MLGVVVFWVKVVFRSEGVLCRFLFLGFLFRLSWELSLGFGRGRGDSRCSVEVVEVILFGLRFLGVEELKLRDRVLDVILGMFWDRVVEVEEIIFGERVRLGEVWVSFRGFIFCSFRDSVVVVVGI